MSATRDDHEPPDRKATIALAIESVEVECERVLRSLPAWFGIEASLLEYVRDTRAHPTFVLRDEASVSRGFVTVKRHFEEAYEIHCLAVGASSRGKGLGRALVEHAAAWAASRGGKFLQVKTLADAHPSPESMTTLKYRAPSCRMTTQALLATTQRSPAASARSCPGTRVRAWPSRSTVATGRPTAPRRSKARTMSASSEMTFSRKTAWTRYPV